MSAVCVEKVPVLGSLKAIKKGMGGEMVELQKFRNTRRYM